MEVSSLENSGIAMIDCESRLITVGQSKWVCLVFNPQLKFNPQRGLYFKEISLGG
jgi:hypothetical protein